MSNNLVKCGKCVELNETICKLKNESILMKDKLMVCEQQNTVLNNIRIQSFKCLGILNAIIDRLENSKQNSEKETNFNENEMEMDLDSQSSFGQTVHDLRFDYHKNYKSLDNWFQQLELVNGIKSYPRIRCEKYTEKVVIRRSNRVSLPVNHFTSSFTTNEKDFKKLTKEEIKSFSQIKKESHSEERVRCPYPNCNFSTRRGAIGLKEHSVSHTRKISENKMNPNVSPTPNLKTKSSSGLRCTFPKCQYVTHSGMYNLRRHIRRVHSKLENTEENCFEDIDQNLTEVKNTSSSKKGSLLRCSYPDCHYTTFWGMYKLRLHMQKHSAQTAIRPKPQNNFALNSVNKTIGSNKTFLRCNKCSFKTKWGLSKLREHLRIHNREEPFKCDKCDASFRQTFNLIRHKQKCHSDDTRKLNAKSVNYLQCSVCERTFTKQSNLRRHEKTHKKYENENCSTPHQCPHDGCQFTSDKIGLLQKHVITHIFNKKTDDLFRNESTESEETTKTTHVKDNSTETLADESQDFVTESVAQEVTDEVMADFGSNVMNKTRQKRKKNSENGNHLELKGNTQSDTPMTDRLIQSLFKCDANNCSFTATKAEDWIKHNDWHELQEKPTKQRFKCIQCKKSYSKLSLLKAHQRLKKHSSYDCGHCAEEFRSEVALQKHIHLVHTQQDFSRNEDVTPISPNTSLSKTNFCDFPNCNKSFVLLKNKLSHMKKVHRLADQISDNRDQSALLNSEEEVEVITPTDESNSDSVLISCPVIGCGHKFQFRALMLTHFNKLHKHIDDFNINITDDSSRCPECGQLFNNAGNMRRHKTQAHKGVNSVSETLFMSSINPEVFNENRNYLCQRTGCGKWFESAISLRQHLNSEHNRNFAEYSNYENQSQEVQPYQNTCDICHIDCIDSDNLEHHLRSVHNQIEDSMPIMIDTNADNDSLYEHTEQIEDNDWLSQQILTPNLFDPIIEDNANNFSDNQIINNSVKIEMI